MNPIRLLAETPDTVTLSRADWLRVLVELEDTEDRAAVVDRRAGERRVGQQAARRSYLNAGEALRLIDGEHPLRIWRKKRGYSQRALAAQAGIGGSYLAEIESGRKPGSDRAYRKLAAALELSPDDLDCRNFYSAPKSMS